MQTPITVPDLGLGPEMAIRLSLWLARPGEHVTSGQPVAELAAGPVVVDVPSPGDGRLGEHLVDEDSRVTAGKTLTHVTRV